MQDKYAEEDERIAHLEQQAMAVYQTLSDGLADLIKSIDISTLPKDGVASRKTLDAKTNQIRSLMLHKSPFAQLQLCMYSIMLTAISLDAKLLSIISKKSLRLMEAIVKLTN